MKIALGIEYRGTGFNGWQIQPDCPSVQQALEDALETFLQVKTPTMCAGRTDTGVHAMQQVVSIETQADRPERSWVRGLNTYLPPGVAVRWARRVDDDFHARFSARSRTYEYWIYNDPVRSPILDDLTGWVFRPLDVERMREGAACLVGEHDFTSFRASECQASGPVRTIRRLELERRGRLIGVRIEANAFLQHMVRNNRGHAHLRGHGPREARVGRGGPQGAQPRRGRAHLQPERPIPDGRGLRGSVHPRRGAESLRLGGSRASFR